MGEAKDPHDDDRIEELLGQLQGIFSKLSHVEKEEASQKESLPPPPASTPPSSSPVQQDPPPSFVPPPPAPPVAKPNPVQDIPVSPAPVESSPPISAPASQPAPNPMPIESKSPVEMPAKVTETQTSAVASAEVAEFPLAPEKTPIVIAYPMGHQTEAQTLAGKLETMTPKFTKVEFHLGVRFLIPYNPKADWRETLIQLAHLDKVRALFMIVDHPVEETKRKGFTAELDQRGIYFQEVPFVSIEKKAFYTDLLLGLVFFFDSHKPPTSPKTEG